MFCEFLLRENKSHLRCNRLFCGHFPVFICSMPSKEIIIVIDSMFLGINMFRALLRAHFNPCLAARAEMILSRAQNIFMTANVNSIVFFFFQFIVRP